MYGQMYVIPSLMVTPFGMRTGRTPLRGLGAGAVMVARAKTWPQIVADARALIINQGSFTNWLAAMYPAGQPPYAITGQALVDQFQADKAVGRWPPAAAIAATPTPTPTPAVSLAPPVMSPTTGAAVASPPMQIAPPAATGPSFPEIITQVALSLFPADPSARAEIATWATRTYPNGGLTAQQLTDATTARMAAVAAQKQAQAAPTYTLPATVAVTSPAPVATTAIVPTSTAAVPSYISLALALVQAQSLVANKAMFNNWASWRFNGRDTSTTMVQSAAWLVAQFQADKSAGLWPPPATTPAVTSGSALLPAPTTTAVKATPVAAAAPLGGSDLVKLAAAIAAWFLL